jgi:DNA repair exonuclease SbcCD ATPase subunit
MDPKAEISIPEDLHFWHEELVNDQQRFLNAPVRAVRELIERCGKLESDLRSADEALEAQRAKYDGCLHKPTWDMVGCGCSLDKIGDVCGLHAPALRQAQEQNAKLENAARAARDYLLECGQPLRGNGELWTSWQEKVSGRRDALAALDAALGGK